ncbi:MAG: hypothetical protein QOI77_95 [Blastocatellia bacterium]|nr:hypothetical protein [Blastocatellia bacterium]
MRAYESGKVFLFVRRGRESGIRRQNINRVDAAVKPSPNPLPVGEGEEKKRLSYKIGNRQSEIGND